MKKLIYLLPLLMLAGCSPQFAGGGFIIPILTGAPAVYCWVRFYKTRLKIPFVLAVILSLATIIITLVMALDV